MKIKTCIKVQIGKDETSKSLARLVLNGEKLFWIKSIIIKEAL